MELGLPNPNSTDKEASTEKKPATRGVEGWRRIFARPDFLQDNLRKEKKEKQEREEDDDDDETPKSKRVRSILKRLSLFRSSDSAESHNEPKSSESESKFFRGLLNPMAEVQPPITPVSVSESTPLQPRSLDMQPTGTEDSAQQVSANPEVVDTVLNEDEDENTPDSRDSSNRTPTPTRVAGSGFGATQDGANPGNFAPPSPYSDAAERNRQRYELADRDPLLNAVALGLVAEHIGRRHADNNIKERVAKQGDQVHEQVQGLRSADTRIERRITADKLESDRKFQAQTLAAAAEKRRSQDQQQREVARIEPAIAASARSPEQRQSSQTGEHLVPPVAVLAAAELARTEIKPSPDTYDTKRYAEAHIAPEAVMKKVAEAAERNIPLERMYERRHEVKDDPANMSGASSVGSVLAGVAGGYGLAAANQSTTSDSQLSAQVLLKKAEGSDPRHSSYKSAAVAGFGAALTLMVFGIIAYIFVS